MKEKYASVADGVREACVRGDYWGVVRLRLYEHELLIHTEGTTGAGAFVSRNNLLKAISEYAKNHKEAL